MNTNNYLPFDLETALKHPERVVTRDGRKVQELHQFKASHVKQTLYGVVNNTINCWSNDGRYSTTNTESDYDLFLLPEVKECWVNVYQDGERIGLGNSYQTKEKAFSAKHDARGTYIKTILVTNEPE